MNKHHGNAPSGIGRILGAAGFGILFGPAGAVAGAIAGASIADTIIQESKIRDVQKQLAWDYEKLDRIREIVEEIKSKVDNIGEQCPGITAQFEAVLAEILAIVGSSDSATTHLELSVAEIPIDLIETVQSSVDPEREFQPNLIKQLTDIVEQLEEQKEAIKEQAQIRDKKSTKKR